MTTKEIVLSPQAELVQASEVPSLLDAIRPQWQAKDLIDRVRRLLPVDPSSACQRLFNAAAHDMREKVVIAGVDIAKEAARLHKLPPVERPEDVEEYPTAKLIDLAYRMGLLDRAAWRRLFRCYEIRRDLEHEDDEYEAGVEDCVYIFKTCIDVVLSRDPIHLLRVADVKELIEAPQAAVPAPSLLEDFAHAPQMRQEDIIKCLCSIAIDEGQPDLVRQNAFTFLSQLSDLASNQAKLAVAGHIQEKITRHGPTRASIRVAYAAGVLAYINRKHLRDYYRAVYENMRNTGHRWSQFQYHGELLRSFKDIGGLLHCPEEERGPILLWLALCYIGEQGGATRYGHVREVFNSDTAEPLIVELIRDAKTTIRDGLLGILNGRQVQDAAYTKHLARRVEALRDIVQEGNGEQES